MKGSFNQMLHQAQRMQTRINQAMESVAGMSADGEAGGGTVRAVVTGKMRLQSIAIAEEVVRDGDRAMIEDLVTAAVNAALEKMEQTREAEMQKASGGFSIPGLR